jgi:hypothetical protein|tara:strand:- start:1018 stop:3090 length:2073 start_codon:yes stop_codon:yes gene_type:complete
MTQITEVPFVIGSGSDDDLVLPAIGEVYPEHCEIDITESGEASLKSLNPKAVLFVNGQPATTMPLESEKNYLAQIGNSFLVVTGSPDLEKWASVFTPDMWEAMDASGEPLEPMTSVTLSKQVIQGNLPDNVWITFSGIALGEAVIPLSRLLATIKPADSGELLTPVISDDTIKILDKGKHHCPSCMKQFDDAMWIATHEDLRPDPVLKERETGPGDREVTFIRFFPDASNLMPDGSVKDAMGSICTQMACPHCRLVLPPGYLLTKNEVISIVGDQASGKSYLLTILTKRLPEILLRNFSVNLTDLDPQGNIPINTMANTLFSGSSSSQARLIKTTLDGNMYQDVHYNGTSRKMPKPFTFSVSSDSSFGGDGHSLTFFDNAGEHFQPGMDTEDRPGAKHVGMASGILFLFDPFNSNDFRPHLGASADPQIEKPVEDKHKTMLDEMYARMQKRRNLSYGQKVDSPLAMVIGKYDAWTHRYGRELFKDPLENSLIDYNLPYGDWILGSGDDAHIQVNIDTISHHHVKISLNDERVILTDLGSSNGTYVDGVPLQANVPAVIKPNTKIKLHQFTLTLDKFTNAAPDGPQYELKLIERLSAINQAIVDANSQRMRAIMMEISPAVIASAENISQHVRYFPVSCFGHNAVKVNNEGEMGPNPKQLDPYMVEVPVLWMLSLMMPEYVPSLEPHLAYN